MGYIRAEDVLPSEVLTLVQEYVDGEMLYIPKKNPGRNQWGSLSGIRDTLKCRNKQIFEDSQNGSSVTYLAQKYFLSEKSIRKIIRDNRPSNGKNAAGPQGGYVDEPREQTKDI